MRLRLNRSFIMEAVEERLAGALSLGWQRAHKHNDAPTPEQVQDQQLQEVESRLWDIFDITGDQPNNGED